MSGIGKKLADAWERAVLGSDDGQKAADELRKAQEEAAKKQDGK